MMRIDFFYAKIFLGTSLAMLPCLTFSSQETPYQFDITKKESISSYNEQVYKAQVYYWVSTDPDIPDMIVVSSVVHENSKIISYQGCRLKNNQEHESLRYPETVFNRLESFYNKLMPQGQTR